jgi:SAM-dependent methyltransferase
MGRGLLERMRGVVNGLAGGSHGDRVVDEHFVPGGDTDLLSAIRLGDFNAVHHLIRYDWAARCLEDWPVSSVLDLATGSGYGAHTMAGRIPSARVTGVDYDADAIREARQRYSRPNLEFQSGDGTRWRQTIGPRKYDVIVSFDMIEHVAHREILMENVVNHLEPQGALLLSTPCGWDETNLQPDWHPHKLEYSAASLFDFLRRYFSTIVRPEESGFPHLEVFDQLANGPVTYFLRMNPVVCRGPLVLANPYIERA